MTQAPAGLGPAAPASSDPADNTPPLYGFFIGCGILTAAVWLNMLIQFLTQSAALDKAQGICTVYLMLLGLYGGIKHVNPSTPGQQDSRMIRGSFFVWFWVGTCAVMYLLADNGLFGLHKVPHDLLNVTGGVFAIFLTTKVAKAFIPRGRGAAFKLPAAPSAGRGSPAPQPGPQSSPAPAAIDPVFKLLVTARETAWTTGEIAQKLGISKTGVRRKLHGLIEAGVVEKISAGPTDSQTRYRFKPDRPAPGAASAPQPDPLDELLNQEPANGGSDAALSALQRRVLALLVDHRDGLTSLELKVRLGAPAVELDAELARLVDSGRVVRKGPADRNPRYVLAQ